MLMITFPAIHFDDRYEVSYRAFKPWQLFWTEKRKRSKPSTKFMFFESLRDDDRRHLDDQAEERQGVDVGPVGKVVCCNMKLSV